MGSPSTVKVRSHHDVSADLRLQMYDGNIAEAERFGMKQLAADWRARRHEYLLERETPAAGRGVQ